MLRLRLFSRLVTPMAMARLELTVRQDIYFHFKKNLICKNPPKISRKTGNDFFLCLSAEFAALVKWTSWATSYFSTVVEQLEPRLNPSSCLLHAANHSQTLSLTVLTPLLSLMKLLTWLTWAALSPPPPLLLLFFYVNFCSVWDHMMYLYGKQMDYEKTIKGLFQ